MKKSLTALAVAAAISVPAIASAESTWYGRTHVSLENFDDAGWKINGVSNRANSIGVKGSMDTNLMDFKAIYKLEAGVDLEQGKKVTGLGKERDTYVGMSSKSIGTVRAGTVESPVKSTAKIVDPLFTTSFEGRGALGLTSGGEASSGDGKGRSTNAVRYDSPNIAGLKVSALYNLNPTAKDNIDIAAVYKMKDMTFFVDHYIMQSGDGGNGTAATKLGTKLKFGAVQVSGHYELDAGKISGDPDDTQSVLFANAAYTMGATMLTFSYGMKGDGSASDSTKKGSSGMALAVAQKVNKKGKIYAGWGQTKSNADGAEAQTMMAIGMSQKF